VPFEEQCWCIVGIFCVLAKRWYGKSSEIPLSLKHQVTEGEYFTLWSLQMIATLVVQVGYM